jgi:DNA-damage-inducible protein J
MKQPRYNEETEAAMQEARDIMSGKKKGKSYSSADELFTELDASRTGTHTELFDKKKRQKKSG